jgi:hypothetical protein
VVSKYLFFSLEWRQLLAIPLLSTRAPEGTISMLGLQHLVLGWDGTQENRNHLGNKLGSLGEILWLEGFGALNEGWSGW